MMPPSNSDDLLRAIQEAIAGRNAPQAKALLLRLRDPKVRALCVRALELASPEIIAEVMTQAMEPILCHLATTAIISWCEPSIEQGSRKGTSSGRDNATLLDVQQISTLRMLEQMRIKVITNPKGFAYKLAYYTALGYMKDSKKDPFPLDNPDLIAKLHEDDLEGERLSDDEVDFRQAAMANLPDLVVALSAKECQIFALLLLADMSNREISSLLTLSEGNIRVQRHNIKVKSNDLLQESLSSGWESLPPACDTLHDTLSSTLDEQRLKAYYKEAVLILGARYFLEEPSILKDRAVSKSKKAALKLKVNAYRVFILKHLTHLNFEQISLRLQNAKTRKGRLTPEQVKLVWDLIVNEVGDGAPISID